MSNPSTSRVVFLGDDLPTFLARANQFSEPNADLVQQKFNKKQADGSVAPVFAALSSRSRTVAQWGNLMDDFLLAFFGAPGPQQGIVLDTRGTPLVTGDATAGGGTVDFLIVPGRDYGVGIWLKVESIANSVSGLVEFFSDAARTKLVYQSLIVDAAAAPSDTLVDGTPWTSIPTDATNLEAQTLYGRIGRNLLMGLPFGPVTTT